MVEPAPRRSSAPSRAACIDASAIDWRNAALRHGSVLYQFEDGKFTEYLDATRVEWGVSLELGDDGDPDTIWRAFGDVDGDGCGEAVLAIIDRSHGTNRSRTALWVVRPSSPTTADVRTQLPGGDGYCGWHTGFQIREGALWVTRAVFPGDPPPDDHFRGECVGEQAAERRERWIWQRGRLVEDLAARRRASSLRRPRPRESAGSSMGMP